MTAPKLLVQDYLLDHSLGQLAAEHGVYARFDAEGRKFSLSYDQIEARDSDPIVQECRGLILARKDPHPDTKRNDRYTYCWDGTKLVSGKMGQLNFDDVIPGETRALAVPLFRFFNLSQGAAATIDFDDPATKVMEKLDGTLIIAYWCPFTKQWHCATRGVPEANLPLDSHKELTFRTLFDRAFKETMGEDFTDAADGFEKHHTYMFELTTPYNRVVCQYNDFRITLLGARDLRTLEEIDVHAKATPPDKPIPNTSYRLNGIPLNLPRVKVYALKTPADIIKWVGEQNPLSEDGEGVVVLDKHFNRVKIKNPAHGLLSRAKDKLGSSTRNCLELALSGKEDDFVSVLPTEIVKNVADCKEGVRLLIRKCDEGYSRISAGLGAMASQKDFALAVQASGIWQTPMFKMRAGKASSTREFIDGCKRDGEWSSSFLDTLLELIDKDKPKASSGIHTTASSPADAIAIPAP